MYSVRAARRGGQILRSQATFRITRLRKVALGSLRLGHWSLIRISDFGLRVFFGFWILDFGFLFSAPLPSPTSATPSTPSASNCETPRGPARAASAAPSGRASG